MDCPCFYKYRGKGNYYGSWQIRSIGWHLQLYMNPGGFAVAVQKKENSGFLMALYLVDGYLTRIK